jgi:hypothetical protein
VKNYQRPVVSKSLPPKATETWKTKYFEEIDNFNKNLLVTDDPAPLANVTDPITWWTAMDAAGHPLILSRIERAFSRGGLTVSKMRHSLSDRSVHAATLVGSWAAFPGLIPQAELIQAFDEKGKRLKGKAPIFR